jgi:ribosomal protein S18 acetylase RimI-like enzyme
MPTPNSPKITLRPANENDREFLWWLHQATMREYVDKTWGWDDHWQQERFDQGFEPTRVQIIEKDQKAIGYLSTDRKPEEIFLASIEIAPEFQNQGIATELILRLFSEADEAGIPVKLFVLKMNPARRLYERLGFHCVTETNTHYVMSRPPETAA